MSTTIISIVVSYIVLGFLLLIFNLRTSYHWFIKTIMIISTTFFYILTYNSFKEILGWPTKEVLPDRFRLVGAQIYEPNIIDKKFFESDVINDICKFKSMSDLIVSNRVSSDLDDVSDIIFSRDIFGVDT